MNVLLAIDSDSNLKHIRFNLNWKWIQRSFLDGSCLAFCGSQLGAYSDCHNVNPVPGSILSLYFIFEIFFYL